jgi:hypothetical protein
MTQEALKLALEALENGDVPTPKNVGKNLDAITAIKQALAQTPQRTWVGLTDEERIEIDHLALSRVQAVQMTEAKLKELNT